MFWRERHPTLPFPLAEVMIKAQLKILPHWTNTPVGGIAGAAGGVALIGAAAESSGGDSSPTFLVMKFLK